LRLLSPRATAPDEEILRAAHLPIPSQTECTSATRWVEEAFDRHLTEIYDASDKNKEGWTPAPLSYLVRTIGTDDRLADLLVDELLNRGLDPHSTNEDRQIVLVSEWDSIYARTFAETLRARFRCPRNGQAVTIDVVAYYYMRGLDGSTVAGDQTTNPRGSDSLRADESRRDVAKAASSAHAALPVEWPEGGSQRDYLRRLVRRLGDADWWDSNAKQVEAVGIIGGDVHDKLMIAQALRKTLQDRTIFTTDLDARLFHPAVSQYTRNLVVASSLPLVLKDDLQCGVLPFRDDYQTATFLAARIAVAANNPSGNTFARKCGVLSASQLKSSVQKLVAAPYIFEIARDRAVELPAAKVEPRTPLSQHEAKSRTIYAILAGVVFASLGVVMIFGKPGPAMWVAGWWWSSRDPGPIEQRVVDGHNVVHAGRSTVVVAGVEAAALGFATGVAIELGVPGRVGPVGTVLLALAAAAFLWTFIYPGTPWVRNFRATRGQDARPWEALAAQALIFVVIVAALWWVCVWPRAQIPDAHEPFDAFNGASAWPSQLLRTLVIVLFAWFLDYAWCRAESDADRLGTDYFPTPGSHARNPAPGLWHRLRVACQDATIWLWRPAGADPCNGLVDGNVMWQDYRRLLRGRARLARITAWLSAAIALIILVSALIGGVRTENPTRGIADRQLVAITLIVSSVMVIFLLVLVGDATVLTWRFITGLKSGRTCYPEDTVQRLAAELGAKQVALLAAREFAPLPANRWTTPGQNTLLDDWIDARLLGELTASVGRLIIFPFVLVALMIVARSQLFDNWQMGPSILTLLGSFVLGTLAMAQLLNWGAEKARRRAVERMEADLVWLKGSGEHYAKLAEEFSLLIDQVKNMKKGAFAPFLEQPLLKALIVPLGGAGGIQLLEYLLFGSSS
jgi:hypothetical protein